jgi:hypothetical protein
MYAFACSGYKGVTVINLEDELNPYIVKIIDISDFPYKIN